MFFQFLKLKQSQMKTATTMAPNKRLQIARSLSFFCTFIRFCMQKKESNNQKFKILRTQTFSRVISNSKRARTKFKLIGKFKILRKLKQHKAFLARSLSFFAHLVVLVRKATRKVRKVIKQFKDLRRNTNSWPSNIQFKTCEYKV